MSESLDPELIEQTKRQIRALVNEIAQLSRSDIAPAEFYSEFLTRVVSALAATGGVVWTLAEEGRLTLQYQINLQQSGLRGNEEGQVQHSRLLSKVLNTGEALLVPPHSGAAEDDNEAVNPTDFLLVLGPLKTEIEVVGVVEIFQRPEAGLSTQKGYLRFLMQMCDLAADFIKGHQLRHFSDRQVLWTQLEDFTRRVHATLDPWLTAYTIANEGRRLIECDRVSVAIRRGRKCRIEAVSGQDLLDKRSNTVRMLGQLATRVVDSGEAVWYTGDASNLAPQVEEAVQDYVDESHTKMVAVLPLVRPAPGEEEQDPENPSEPEEPVGALIVERIEDSRIPETMLHRVAVVAQHSSVALANAMEHQDLFLMPLWRMLGKSKWLFRARTLPKTIAVSIAVLALIAFLVFFPWPFELKADGTLEAIVRRRVFARVDGDMKQVFVKHDQPVREGDPLIELRSTAIATELEETIGNLRTTQEEINGLEAQRNQPHLSTEDELRIWGQIAQLREKQNSLIRREKILREKAANLLVRSPCDGRVVTWDVEFELTGRSIKRGDVLMEIANTAAKGYQLELKMPEDDMGYLVDAQKKFDKQELDVTFILATEPGTEYKGKIKEVWESAEVIGEEGNVVLVKVEITDPLFDKTKLAQLRPGAEVRAKVYCGERSVGFIVFHDLMAFIQSRILFRF